TWTAALVLLAAILVLAIPSLARAAIRTVRTRAARRGDVAAAWRELRATAVDAGIDLLAAESPRAFGHRIVSAGAPRDDVDALVAAIERRSFAATDPPADDLAAPLGRIATALRAEGLAARIRQTALPRSLGARGRDPAVADAGDPSA